MATNSKCYKDSLHFDLFDLRVIKCGIYNKDKFFVAKILHFYPYITNDSGLVLIEILPLYTVGREEGIFTKKPLQNYNNIHSLLVPDNIARVIKDRWVDIKKGENFLISFLKDKLYTKKFASKKDTCTSFTILPRDTIIVSSNESKTYYKVPPYSLPAKKIILPSILINLLRCTKVIQLDRLQWQTYHFLDATQVKQLMQKYGETKDKSLIATKTARDTHVGGCGVNTSTTLSLKNASAKDAQTVASFQASRTAEQIPNVPSRSSTKAGKKLQTTSKFFPRVKPDFELLYPTMNASNGPFPKIFNELFDSRLNQALIQKDFRLTQETIRGMMRCQYSEKQCFGRTYT